MLNKYIIILFFFISTANCFAGKRYWIGNGTNVNWNSTSNWSSTSGGSGGSTVPSSNDTAYFDNNGLGKCSLNVNIGLKRIEVLSSYSDTIHHFSNTVTIGTSGAFVLNGGVFWGGTGDITCNGIFTISGGIFRSTTALLKIYGNYSFTSGTFIHNSGMVHFAQHMSISGSTSFYDLKLFPANSGSYNLDSTTVLTCEHNLVFEGASGTRVNIGSIHAKGDLYLNNTYSNNLAYTGGTATIKINGNGNQTVFGNANENKGLLCNIVVDKAGTDTLFLKDNITLAGSLTYVSGVINVTKYNSTVTFSGGARTISGSFSLKNVCFNSSLGTSTTIINASDTLTVLNEIREEGANGIYINTGTINLKGNLALNNTYNNISMGGSGVIVFSGTTDQEVIGSTTLYASRICNLKVLKSSGNLILKNYITFGDNAGLQKVSGQIDATTFNSSLIFTRGTRTISGNFTLNDLIFNSTGTTGTNNIQSSDTITVNGDLKLEGTNPIILNGGRIKAKKNIVITNTSTATTTSTATVEICGTIDQTFTGSGVSLAGKICKIIIDKNSGTLFLNSIITYISDWDYKKGNINAGSSTIVSYGSPSYFKSKTGENVFTLNNFRAGWGSTTLNSDIKIRGDLFVNGSTTLNGNSKTIEIGGNWDNTGVFSFSGTTVILNGDSKKGRIIQNITKPSSSISINNLIVEKDTGNVYLKIPVFVYGQTSLKFGAIVTSSANLLTFANGSTLNVNYPGNNNSYICGPVKKVGNSDFVFPLGDTLQGSNAFHPLGIISPVNTTDAFTANYYNGFSSNDTAVVDSIEICKNEYWTIARNVGSTNIAVTIGWNANNCLPTNTYDMIVSNWDGTKWKSLEGTNIAINGSTGSVKSVSTPLWNGTNPANLTLGKKKELDVSSLIVEPYCLVNQAVGSISNTLKYGSPPFTYLWSHGPSTKDLTNLAKGDYSLTITDRKGRTFNKSFTLKNCVLWESLPSTLIKDSVGSITKVTGGSNWENAIIHSTKIFDSIQNNEWVEFTIADTLSSFLIGYASPLVDSTINESNLAFFINGKNLIIIETDNDGFYSKIDAGIVGINDRLKIELNEEQGIKYLKNGTLIQTGKLLPSSRLMLQANLFSNSSKIKGVRCSNN